MAEQGFNCEQVGAIFIKVCAKRMAERMAGQLMFEAKFLFFGKNKLIYGIRSHGPCGILTVGEEEPRWPAGMEPVLSEDIQGIPGEDRIPVRTRFGMTDMDAHGGAADVPHIGARRLHQTRSPAEYMSERIALCLGLEKE